MLRLQDDQDRSAAAKSDLEVVEDALAVYLGLRALDEPRAQGTLDPDAADRRAIEKVRAVRRERRDPA